MLEENKINIGDCTERMRELEDDSVDLIVTDPPYNIGWKYSDSFKDKFNRTDYERWCLEWSELAIKKLSENGVMVIINYPENNNVLYTDLKRKGYKIIQQLIWNYPSNIGQSKTKYTRTHRTILVIAKGESYTFNPVKQPYKNPSDKRVKKLIENGNEGTTHYDVFTINLCKNVSKSKKRNGINQLPDKLVETLIKTYSREGDLVLDPFAGNGTVIEVAGRMGRRAIGIDINDYNEV